MTLTIIHGGQTGVDRGAWRGAVDVGLPVEGYAPSDGKDELGRIPAEVMLSLKRCPGRGYPARTRRNVESADAVIIVTKGRKLDSPGSRLTHELATQIGRPVLVVESCHGIDGVAIGEMLADLGERDLRVMVAGPRASKWREGHAAARELVMELACILECEGIASGEKKPLADVLEHFNERAAIREYDGGMSRAEAERAALDDVRRKR